MCVTNGKAAAAAAPAPLAASLAARSCSHCRQYSQVRPAMPMTSGADGAAAADAVSNGDVAVSQRGWQCTSSSTRTGDLSSACRRLRPEVRNSEGTPTPLSTRMQA